MDIDEASMESIAADTMVVDWVLSRRKIYIQQIIIKKYMYNLTNVGGCCGGEKCSF